MCSKANPCRVLFIEDDELLIKLFKAKDEQGDFLNFSLGCTIARSIADAAGCIESTPKPYDVISLDLKLQESSGMATFDAVHKLVGDTPIFIYTGDAERSFIDVVVAHGAERVLLKGEWSLNQYLTLLHYGAGRTRSRGRLRDEKEFYRKLSEEQAKELKAINEKVKSHDSQAEIELEKLIGRMEQRAALI